MKTPNNLRKRRTDLGLNEVQVAAVSGISPQQVRNLETGINLNPSLETARGLARALRCTVDELFPAMSDGSLDGNAA